MMKHSKSVSSLMPPELKSSQKEKRLQFGMSYRDTYHETLPHVLKFSGGRSSGMMLMNMLEKNLFNQSRGDVVVFNNTSAEHQKTYEFVSKCKTFCETEFGIPFFIVEYCTYEDAYQGDYIRMPTFRLANGSPHSQSNPDGYRWRGEVFEELLSLNGVLPSIFQRTCTIALKLETTRKFLKEWFLNKPLVKRRGHFGKTSRINKEEGFLVKWDKERNTEKVTVDGKREYVFHIKTHNVFEIVNQTQTSAPKQNFDFYLDDAPF